MAYQGPNSHFGRGVQWYPGCPQTLGRLASEQLHTVMYINAFQNAYREGTPFMKRKFLLFVCPCLIVGVSLLATSVHAGSMVIDFTTQGNQNASGSSSADGVPLSRPGIDLGPAGFGGETFDITVTGSTDGSSTPDRLIVHSSNSRGLGLDTALDDNTAIVPDPGGNLLANSSDFKEALTISFDNFTLANAIMSIDLLWIGGDVQDSQGLAASGESLSYTTSGGDSGIIDNADLADDANTTNNRAQYNFDQSTLPVSTSGGSITLKSETGDGLRIARLTITVEQIPEPASAMLVLLGLGAFASVLPRRK